MLYKIFVDCLHSQRLPSIVRSGRRINKNNKRSNYMNPYQSIENPNLMLQTILQDVGPQTQHTTWQYPSHAEFDAQTAHQTEEQAAQSTETEQATAAAPAFAQQTASATTDSAANESTNGTEQATSNGSETVNQPRNYTINTLASEYERLGLLAKATFEREQALKKVGDHLTKLENEYKNLGGAEVYTKSFKTETINIHANSSMSDVDQLLSANKESIEKNIKLGLGDQHNLEKAIEKQRDINNAYSRLLHAENYMRNGAPKVYFYTQRSGGNPAPTTFYPTQKRMDPERVHFQARIIAGLVIGSVAYCLSSGSNIAAIATGILISKCL